MKLIVISSPGSVPREADTVNALFDEGLQVFHLRKPEWNAQEMDAIVSKVKPEHRDKLAIHSNHVKHNDWGIHRLHFTEVERQKLPDEFMKELAEKNNLSTSVHTVKMYDGLSEAFAYTFCGPVFTSISKPGYQSDEQWKESRKDLITKRIALGGIDEHNIGQLSRDVFHGAALLGAIWSSSDRIKKFNVLRSLLVNRITAA